MPIVADRGNHNPGHGYQALVIGAPLATEIKEPADLKGRTYSEPGPDGTGEVSLATYLHKGGLTIKDVNFVALNFSDMQGAAKGSVNARFELFSDGCEGGVGIARKRRRWR